MIIFSKDKLKEAWKEIYLSKPSKKRDFSRGVDKITISSFKKREDYYLDEIYRQLESGFFKFDKLYYYSIKQKGKKKPRDIQAPTVKDRIVQKIINEYLVDNYFKGLFDKTGVVGSVKNNSLESIIKKVLNYYNNGYVYVLKTDIINYFPSINIKRINRIIGYYVKDEEIKKFLLDYLNVSKLPGIPQGPPLSPLMANLYLLSIDSYLEKRKKIRHIRYVDDVLIFGKTENDVKKAYSLLLGKFNKIGLKIHPLEDREKTKIGKLNKGDIDILGVVYKDDKLLIKEKKYKNFINNTINPLSFYVNLIAMKGKTKKEKLTTLIEHFNHKLKGWGGAYIFCNVGDSFKNLDLMIEKNIDKLLKIIEYKDGKMSNKEKIKVKKSIVKLSEMKIRPIIKG